MSAPVASFLQLPDDSARTGKKVRTQTRLVGTNTVHEHEFQWDKSARILGTYAGSLTQATVSALVQDALTTGFLWAFMPTGVVGLKARLRRVFFTSQHSSALLTPTAPRLAMARFTYSGTATGAPAVPADSSAALGYPKLDLRTAVTGLTVTLGALVATGGICGALSAIAAYSPAIVSASELISGYSEEDEWMVLAPGEGVVLYQDVAGTTADTRKLNIGLVWDEIDTA